MGDEAARMTRGGARERAGIRGGFGGRGRTAVDLQVLGQDVANVRRVERGVRRLGDYVEVCAGTARDARPCRQQHARRERRLAGLGGRMRAALGRLLRRGRGGGAHPEQAQPEEHMNAGDGRGVNSEVTVVVRRALIRRVVVKVLLDSHGGEGKRDEAHCASGLPATPSARTRHELVDRSAVAADMCMSEGGGHVGGTHDTRKRGSAHLRHLASRCTSLNWIRQPSGPRMTACSKPSVVSGLVTCVEGARGAAATAGEEDIDSDSGREVSSSSAYCDARTSSAWETALEPSDSVSRPPGFPTDVDGLVLRRPGSMAWSRSSRASHRRANGCF